MLDSSHPRGRCHAIILEMVSNPTEYVLWIYQRGQSPLALLLPRVIIWYSRMVYFVVENSDPVAVWRFCERV